MQPSMPLFNYRETKQGLRELYLQDARPWLVGFSGGKDSTMLASWKRWKVRRSALAPLGERVAGNRRFHQPGPDG